MGGSSPRRSSHLAFAASPGRGSLDRNRILASAIELIDREGLKSFTMRRLGAELGVEAMALYHWVSSREDLLDGVVEYVIDELYDNPELQATEPKWRDYLVRLAHAVRRIALTHPQVFPLIASRPPAAPWVRPPLRSLRWMESFLDTLERCGFSDEASVAAYRAFSSFLLGHLLLEVSALGADTSPIEQAELTEPDRADLSGYPLLQRLETMLAKDHSAQEFDDSLESLIDRLDHLDIRR